MTSKIDEPKNEQQTTRGLCSEAPDLAELARAGTGPAKRTHAQALGPRPQGVAVSPKSTGIPGMKNV